MWLIWNLPIWSSLFDILPPSHPSLDPTSSHSSLFSSLPLSFLFPLSAQLFSHFSFNSDCFPTSLSANALKVVVLSPCHVHHSLLVMIWLNFLSSFLVLSDHYSLVTMPVVLDHSFISTPFTLNITPKCEQHHPIPHHPHTGSTT